MTPSVQIRQAKASDSLLLAQLNREVQDLHTELYPKYFKAYDERAVERFMKEKLADSNTIAFVAEKDEKAVGYILAFHIQRKENPFQYAHHFLLIDQIAVLNQFQAKGIGQQLLKKLIEVAKEKKIKEIRTEHWKLNQKASVFFKNSGFRNLRKTMEQPL
ncbi:MAG: GNAT family N-acetyltransferase [Vicingaceae bacterium]